MDRATGASPTINVREVALTLISFALVGFSTGLAYLLHVNLSTASSVELLLVLLVALRFGLLQATIVSVTAVIALNYLFTQPFLQFTVADPKNWVSLITFEAAALLVSRLSSRVNQSARDAELERQRSLKLYELSRAILLIDNRSPVTDQLANLVRELIIVDDVEFWHQEQAAEASAQPPQRCANAFAAYHLGNDADNATLGISRRMLRLGTHTIGAMTLSGWTPDSLLADAVASLAAIALERSRSAQRENEAEAERNTEQLRTAVLDGLAHGFKTPLTAILTASSGLIAISRMSEAEKELVTLIDEEARTLSQMTTRLLQTAALETRDVRLRRAPHSILDLLHEVLQSRDPETRGRIALISQASLAICEVDGPMIRVALDNLIDNAVKYSAVGGEIVVRITQTMDETLITVENKGQMIPLNERERIFFRFYRGSNAAHGPSGTGLGLSIVRKTAEAHGGRAWVESSENGTTFFFALQRYSKGHHG